MEILNNEYNRIKQTARTVLPIALAASLAVMLALFVSMKLVSRAYTKAEEEYARMNNYTVVDRGDGSIFVSGYSNGDPFEYVEDGRIVEGVSVAGVQLGGMDYAEARHALIEDVKENVSDINIRASIENTTLVLAATDFKISCDVNEKLHEALKIGRASVEDNCYEVYKNRSRIAEEGVDLGGYTLTMDEESMRAMVDEIAKVVDKAPTEPYITLKNLVGGGKAGVGIGGSSIDLYTTKRVYAPDGTAMADIEFHNGKNGYVLDREDMLKKIVDAFYSGDYHAEIELSLTETTPTTTAEALSESIGEISRFSTKFASSSDYRARNVQKAAGLLHCVIMEPGVEYSYNDLLGPRNEQDGWLPAPGISGGKEYIDSPGGGICQVSSTIYNSLLKLGPKAAIVKRFHHSIPGSYVDMGLDATVSYGGPDLVWRNDFDTPILIFSYADMKNRTVYEILYGAADEEGAAYEVWSETVETVDPPEPLIIEEPTWPSWYTKTTINPRTGYNVDVYRQKYDSDGNPDGDPEKLYQDKYAAVQEEIHKGTGSDSLPIPQD